MSRLPFMVAWHLHIQAGTNRQGPGMSARHQVIHYHGENTLLIFINVDPVWNEFRGEPKFIELIEKNIHPGKEG